MIDAKTVKAFLKEANGLLQPADKLVLENFLGKSDDKEKLQGKIKIELEDIACTRRQYGDKAKHELDIQKYRVGKLEEQLRPYKELEAQSEGIIRSYTAPQQADVETHPASLTEYGHS